MQHLRDDWDQRRWWWQGWLRIQRVKYLWILVWLPTLLISCATPITSLAPFTIGMHSIVLIFAASSLVTSWTIISFSLRHSLTSDMLRALFDCATCKWKVYSFLRLEAETFISKVCAIFMLERANNQSDYSMVNDYRYPWESAI